MGAHDRRNSQYIHLSEKMSHFLRRDDKNERERMFDTRATMEMDPLFGLMGRDELIKYRAMKGAHFAAFLCK